MTRLFLNTLPVAIGIQSLLALIDFWLNKHNHAELHLILGTALAVSLAILCVYHARTRRVPTS